MRLQPSFDAFFSQSMDLIDAIGAKKKGIIVCLELTKAAKKLSEQPNAFQTSVWKFLKSQKVRT